MNTIEKLYQAIQEIKDISNEDAQELLIENGYVAHEVISEVAQLEDRLRSKAQMRLTLRSMTEIQRKAIIQIAHALKNDSDYRNRCQLAFSQLLGLSGFNHEDPKRCIDLFLGLSRSE